MIGIPALNRPDLLRRCLVSIDASWPVLVIDNSGTGRLAAAARSVRPDARVVLPAANLGVAASWNHVIRTAPEQDWWCLLNSDVALAPGDLDRLADRMQTADLVTLDGFAAFGISARCIERVGFFDENYYPAYVEDCDYEWRCVLAGVPIVPLPSNLRHDRSSTIGDPIYGRQNDRTYPLNVSYHEAKWGGHPRGGERFTTPFDAGGDIRDWRLELGRLRLQAWETTALQPVGWETR